MQRSVRIIALCLGFLVLPQWTFAQGQLGALTGSVLDPSGAVIPEAQITITAVDTGVTWAAKASSAGYYRVPVPPGRYRVEILKEGFKTSRAENIVVPVAQVVTLDVTLEIGTATQSVTVTSEAPLLTPSTAEVSSALSPQEFATLPIAVDDGGRQLMTFIYSSLPGTAGDTWSGSINGAQFFTTDILIEGLPMARYDLQGSITEATPSADAASEFKVQTSSYSAEYGATSGGVANFSMKSGSNGYHGSVYEYFVNPVLNATAWSINSLPPDSPAKVKSPTRENNFGAVFGGPIKKNKTFFFVNYEGDRRRAGSPRGYYTVPTERMLHGDFSEWAVNPDGSCINLAGTDALGRPTCYYEIFDPTSSRSVANGAMDPVTGLVNNSGSTAIVRDGFGFDPVTGLPGPSANIIPSQFFSTASAQLLSKFPTPINSQIANNTVGYGGQPKLTIDKFSIKVDHNLNDKHKMSGFWTYSARSRIMGNTGYWMPPTDYPIDPTKIQSIPFRLARFSEDWTINNHTVNHFSVGYNRFGNFNGQPTVDPTPWLASALGITGGTTTNDPQYHMASTFKPPKGHPARGKRDLESLFGPYERIAEFGTSESFIYADTLSYLRGKHSFKFGGEYRRYRRNDRIYPGTSFNFSNLQTAFGTSALKNRTGHPFASFILGATNGGTRDVIATTPGFRGALTGLYAQDDWRATPKLTASYGLRWELPGVRKEAYNRLSGLDPTLPNPGADGIPGALAFLGNCPTCNGRTSFQDLYYRQFAPRIGLAYEATRKLVVRTGYGISYAPPIANGFPNASTGFNDVVNFGSAGLYPRQFHNAVDPAVYLTPLAGAPLPAYYVNNGRVGIPPYSGTLPNRDPSISNYNTVEYMGRSSAQPYIQNWNFGLQYMLPSEIMLEADYIGSKGTRLTAFDIAGRADQVPTKYMGISQYGDYLTWDIGDALADPGASAALAKFGVTGLPFPDYSGSVSDSLRPFPQYTGIYNDFPNYGNSTYHSLQVTARRRVSKGLNFIAAYTWSKTLSNADSAIGYYGGYYWQDYYNQKNEKSIASFDYRHNLKLTWFYNLPFGKGGKWLNNGGAADKLFGGWQVTAIHNYRSGDPIQIYNSSLDSGLGVGAVRADVIPGVNQKVPFKGPIDSINGTAYLNPAAFGSPPADPLSGTEATRWGTAPRFLSYTRGPGYQSEDFGILKDTHITERFILKFRADFFNVFNRTGMGDPDTDVSSGTFGMILGVSHGPRNIMLSLRLDF
jgi:hypothetical protein